MRYAKLPPYSVLQCESSYVHKACDGQEFKRTWMFMAYMLVFIDVKCALKYVPKQVP